MRRSGRAILSRASLPSSRSSLLSSRQPIPLPLPTQLSRRSLFGFNSSKVNPSTTPKAPPRPTPLYNQDNLFHPLESSPIPALREKSKVIKSLAPCPVCLSHSHSHSGADTSTPTTTTPPKINPVSHSCPDCGFPSHCSPEHYQEGYEEHQEYCGRLREVNEDEHDLRSGRELGEFEMPGPQDYESTISLSTWPLLLYTRNHPSSASDSPRSIRHVSKLLTYPVTIGSVLSWVGPFGGGRGRGEGGRLTREGKRSLAALHTSLHPPIGQTPSPSTRNATLPIRIFILGARAESSLPPHIWDQLCHLFPYTRFEIFFVGPQAALPRARFKGKEEPRLSVSGEEEKHIEVEAQVDGSNEGKPTSTEESTSQTPSPQSKIYSPSTPSQSSETEGKGSTDHADYGVPSYTISVSPYLTLTTLQTPYEVVHEQFGPFDPYTDVFFSFCPGFGFPSSTSKGTLQAQTEWEKTLKQVLSTRCACFVTGFSPRDVERDVKSLDQVEGVKGEYDILLEPGENPFASMKWESGDFDPRVLVRVNWGVWGFRGKRYDVEAKGGEEAV